jgi:tRNA(fMet)-specific endonuclease VapC
MSKLRLYRPGLTQVSQGKSKFKSVVGTLVPKISDKSLTTNREICQLRKSYRQETATATVVIHGMLYGCLRLPVSKKRQDIEDYINNVILAQLPLFDYTLQTAQYHAQKRARLSKVGKSPAFIDGQIASIAVTNDLI